MSGSNPQGFPLLNSPLVDPRTGGPSRPWIQFFMTLWRRTGSGPGEEPAVLPVLEALAFEEDAFIQDQLSLPFGETEETPQPQLSVEADDHIPEPNFQDILNDAYEKSHPTIGYLDLDDNDVPVVSPIDQPAVGASPFSYVSPRRQLAVVSGGTVSTVELSRDGSTFFNVGLTSGAFVLGTGDTLRLTYTVAPTAFVTFPF